MVLYSVGLYRRTRMIYPITEPVKCREVKAAIEAQADCVTTINLVDEECQRLIKKEIVSETVVIDEITGWKFRIANQYFYPLDCSNNAKKTSMEATPIEIPED
jgi:hypothetical protein